MARANGTAGGRGGCNCMAFNQRTYMESFVASVSRALPLLFLALAVVAPSCGVFDTRSSNPPDSGNETPREIPINVDAVLANYANALAYNDPGLYEETLDASFQFVPDPEDRQFFISSLGEDIFESWGRDKELTAVRLIFSASESLTVSFSEGERNISDRDGYIRLDYRFRQRITREGKADSIATFKGFAEIHFIEDDSSMWSIDKWEETITTEFLTWGRLKGSTTGG
jgi:hypothetical protein